MKINIKTLVLNHLEQGKSLTQAEAITLFNSFRLSSIIHCLRNAGHNIVTHWERNDLKPGHHARYELKSLTKK